VTDDDVHDLTGGNGAGYDYDRDDPTFLADLAVSREAVEHVAHWLSVRGHPVFLQPILARPDPAHMAEYGGQWDLGVVWRVEVKRRALRFTGRDDFPFDTVIVDSCHTFDAAPTKPAFVFVLNHDMTACLVVDVRRTKEHWVRVVRQSRGRDRAAYECPVALTTAVQFP
jgi:hypothetical protein